MRAKRLQRAARLGKCSTQRMPGTEVGIVPNSPRISAGAPGLGSNVSRWLGPPTWYNRIQERAVDFRPAPRASAANSLDKLNPTPPSTPALKSWRRWHDVRRNSGQHAREGTVMV